MAAICRRIADSPRFQGFIYAVIVANAVTLGLGTYDFPRASTPRSRRSTTSGAGSSWSSSRFGWPPSAAARRTPFHEEDPENWGDIGTAMLSLFQILTLENWPSFLETGQEIAPGSWIFFVSYVLIASFLVINILIAIIINSMDEVDDAERAADREELAEALAASEGPSPTASPSSA